MTRTRQVNAVQCDHRYKIVWNEIEAWPQVVELKARPPRFDAVPGEPASRDAAEDGGSQIPIATRLGLRPPRFELGTPGLEGRFDVVQKAMTLGRF